MFTGIKYKSGYLYQLAQTYEVQTHIEVEQTIYCGYVTLYTEGLIIIQKGYAWDGPSGPAIDTDNFMRGSLVHDAFYELMRKGMLDPYIYRKKADELLRTHCREDGMSWIRAWWVYNSLRQFGYKAATRENQKPILEAP